jgi:hypothetical protein
VTLRFSDHVLESLRVTAQGSGAVLLTGPAARLRINGDSLGMFQALSPCAVEGQLHFSPGWMSLHAGSQLYLDPYGGCGIYPLTAGRAARPLGADRRFRYELNAGDVLWFAVFPPRPFDWEASLQQRVVWHWSRQNGYPSNEELRAWREWGNVYLLQSEVMLWQDWNLAYQPRDAAELGRVLQTAHGLDGRVLVYTSPGFFLQGTPLAAHALNSFDNFRGWPPTVTDGANVGRFVEEIDRLNRETGVDGLYFDGLYVKSVAASYQVMREARRIVGDDGLLMVHCTSNAPGGDVFLPTTDTYANFLLRGEGSAVRYADPDYLRYFVSGYHVSNAFGILCNNNDHPTTPELVDRLLDANARLSFVVAHDTPERVQALRDLYFPQLTPALRPRVETAAEQSARAAAERFQERMAAGRERTPCRSLDPWPQVCVETFDGDLDPQVWRTYTTPIEGTTLTTQNGALLIRAREHTVAYLEMANQRSVFRVQCRLKISEHSGLSWGPAITLMWPGYFFRVTARADGSFGIDRPGVQDMVGECRADQWYSLRLTLRSSDLICEVGSDGPPDGGTPNPTTMGLRTTGPRDPESGVVSGQWSGGLSGPPDGGTTDALWTEPWRGTAWQGPPSHIIIGKLSLWGDHTNYEDPGEWGETWMDDVEIYAPAS